MIRLAAFLVAAAALTAPTAAKEKAAEAAASPAVWRVSDSDSAVYLFGTLGALPAGASWRSRTLAGAIDASDVLWFEAPVGEAGAGETADRIFRTEGVLPAGKTLTSLLAPERREALAAIAEKNGIPVKSLDGLKPWAAFVVLSAQIGASAGSVSADADLMTEAKGRGRTLKYFETIESSLGVLTMMPETEQVALLSFLLDDFARQESALPATFAAWRDGDAEAIDAHLNQSMRTAAPAAYKRLIADRTQALAAGIAAALKSRETAFIALNAGYLVGPDGLPDALAAAGFKVERLDRPPPAKPELRDD
ncbi:MAG: TraB/GumN family protein [Parvularculaceae bacterium]|nr:TraB/GumN family protein [Parvularculaceae bacterium]